MKRGIKGMPKHRQITAPAASGLRVEINCRVLRAIRQHARSSMTTEICGVLIGETNAEKTIVEASIPGEQARQGGSHVTFTQDTWTHIYQVKDSRYPEKRIVGWYHSHPGFGVFLSDHDLFIHRNFFSDPSQIAWVFDPHSDEEGCFAWEQGEIKRLTEIALRDDPCESGETERPPISEYSGEYSGEEPDRPQPAPSRRTRIVRWVALTLSHILALVLGAVAGAILAPPAVIVIRERADRPSISSPVTQPSVPGAPEEGRKK